MIFIHFFLAVLAAVPATTAALLCRIRMRSFSWGAALMAAGAGILIIRPDVSWAGPASVSQADSSEIYAIMSPLGGVALQPNGKIVVGCGCYLYALDTNSGIIGVIASGAIRFNPDGSLDRTFQCQIEPANVSAPQHTHLMAAPDGKLLLTGVFHSVDGQPRNGYAMLLPDGKLDKSFVPWRGFSNAPAQCGRGGALYSAALLTNGCVAVPSFTIACRFDYLTAYLLDDSGKYVPRPGVDVISNDWPYAQMSLLFRDGGFGVQRSIDWHRNTRTTWSSWPQTHRNLAIPLWGEAPSAADAAVELTSLFREAPIELCRYAVRLPDGGAILAVESTNGSQLMRFDSNWRPDFSFTSSFEGKKHRGYSITGFPNSLVTNAVDVVVSSYPTLVLQPDGKLLLAGEISKLNGEPFPGLARLLPDGSTDPGFHCVIGGDARVMGMALQKDGKIVIVGYFSEVNSVPIPYLARLNPDGSLDETFSRHFTSHDHLIAWRRVPVQKLTPTSAPTTVATVGHPPPAVIEPQFVIITNIKMQNGVALIQYQGNPAQDYILQGSDSLSPPAWTSVITNRTDSSGSGTFLDSDAGNHAMRFYRIGSQ